MSPAEVIQEYRNLLGLPPDRPIPRLEEMLRSLIAYAVTKLPEWRSEAYIAWEMDAVNDPTSVENEMRSRRARAYNQALDDAKAALLAIQNEI